ncbi:MAG: Ig-like domain-containing protein [Bacteroidia bacterium]|nr:Ig-like domain-containing protein [Bacteroidia bacterium]
MTNSLKLSILSLIIFSGCAQQVVPTGGKKDENPPKVISYKPENKSVKFKEDKIILKFDEYITIKDPSQIIISPILKTKPTIESDGKQISIEFLQSKPAENTTYTINFANSVTDVNEGNTLNNFSYVFSTGEYVDSNRVNGKILNAFTNIQEKDVLVGLYKKSTFTDTTIYKLFPNYFGKSRENGSFTIENLPNDSFYLFAFKDENSDNKYQKTELVAFQENIIIPEPRSDSIQINIFQNPLYTQDKLLDSLSRNKHVYEFIVYNPTDIRINPDRKTQFYTKNIPGKNYIDTVQIYIADSKDTVEENFTLVTSDTSFKVSLRTKNRSKLPIQKIDIRIPEKPTDTIKIAFANPIDTLIETKLKFIEDTIETKPSYLKKINAFKYEIYYPYKEGKSYTIELSDSATQDIFGNYNTKTSNLFTNKTLKDFGTMDLKILNNQKKHLLLQLIEKQGQEELIAQQWESPLPNTIKVEYIKPGNYIFKVVEDTNKNRKWDTGNIEKRTQAEKVYYDKTELNIKAYWDIEQTISIDNIITN